MKSFTIILVLFFEFFLCKAQDSAVVISRSMFDKTSDAVYIGGMKEWLFKLGSDTSWAGKNFDAVGWQKLPPEKLPAKYADENGKVEGWFRIRIKLDEALADRSFGIKATTWGAYDVYIDGVLAASFGSTGTRAPFVGYHPAGKLPVGVDIQAGKEYVIALHVVDYLSPLPPTRLRSEDIGSNVVLRITGPGYVQFFLQNGVKIPAVFNTIWIAVCVVLCAFFWLLSQLNRREKDFRLIAIYSTFLALTLFCYCFAAGYVDTSYGMSLFYNVAAILFVSLTLIMAVVSLVKIFNRAISTGLKIFMAIVFAGLNTTSILSNNTGAVTAAIVLLLVFIVCVYYIFSSWKTLKGAQWIIVFGMCFSILGGFLYVITSLYLSKGVSFYYVSLTGYALSFPLSLLVYASVRFKEIIKEVQESAQQVVQLSEERKQQALNQQKLLQEEVDKQTLELRATLHDLKSTQAQLIQSEKMASLGELTAGIAHEIQNPLNFVNNFSEVNAELIDELTGERSKVKGERNEEVEKEMLNDIRQNTEKIIHHGKRADAIVRGMLQHSRTSSGHKELTDINALCDEYLRLAYHGFQAKDKSFHAKFETDFDNSAGKINIVPQDIGRVLLNLINNAFYAVSEKGKPQSVQAGYEPLVSVSTKRTKDKVEIRIADNGNGIPQKIFDKIFQPFFTTKPTGQGTGLGLSLAYDVIKVHGGDIKVETKVGEGTEFIIHLLINNPS